MIEQRAACLQYARGRVDARARWRHRGRSPLSMDCVGLVWLSLRAAGLDIADSKNYSREPWRDHPRAQLRARFGDPIPETEWQPGDIAVFKSPNRGPAHIGLLADYAHGGFALIHAHAQHNVTEHALDARWRRLLIEVYSPWAI